MWIVKGPFCTTGGAIGVIYPDNWTLEEVEDAATNIPHVKKGSELEVTRVPDCEPQHRLRT